MVDYRFISEKSRVSYAKTTFSIVGTDADMYRGFLVIGLHVNKTN
jgi:hypothetical protein